MKINLIVTGDRPPMVNVSKYNYSNTLVFISNEGSGSTEPGDNYLSIFPENCYNVYVCPVVRPCVIGMYFNACYVIYNHNRMCHSNLVVERHWVRQSGCFILESTVDLGMGMTYSNLLCCHGISKQIRDRKFSMREYNDRIFY